MFTALTVESNDTFLRLGIDDADRLSREGSLSKAAQSKDLVEPHRLAAMEESDGSEKISYAPSTAPDEADPVLAVSSWRREAHADESSNLEEDGEVEGLTVFSPSFEDVAKGRLLDGSSPSLVLDVVSGFSCVVYCTERFSRMMSWLLHACC